MNNIKRVDLIDTREAIKQIIYAHTETECIGYERDLDIMRAVTQSLPSKDDFYKFNPNGITGAEKVKNPEHLWCDLKHNIWQVCCGQAKDMNDNDIPNCWYVRVVGTWFDFD
jgi:hypothetical protein